MLDPPEALTRKQRNELVVKLRGALREYRERHGRPAFAQLSEATRLPLSTISRFILRPQTHVAVKTLKALSVVLPGWHPEIWDQPQPFAEFLRSNHGVKQHICRTLKASRQTLQRAALTKPIKPELVEGILRMYPGRIDPQSFRVHEGVGNEGRRLTPQEVVAMTIAGPNG